MDAPQYVHADAPSGSFRPWMFYYTHHSNIDAPQYVHTDVTSHYLCPWMFYDTHHTLYQNTYVLYQIPLSTTNAVHYGLLTVHQSNALFPVTRHQFRMMCDKDILQLLLEDLNQSVSPDNQLPLYQLSNSQLLKQTSSMCRLSAIKTWSTRTSWPLKMGPIGYPNKSEQNYNFTLRTVPEDSTSQNMFSFSVPFHQENAKWWKINVFCDITSENVYWGKITWPLRSSNWSRSLYSTSL
jgi:hypothetical protein